MSTRTGRITQLDGLRAFAFLTVYCYHAWKPPLAWMGVDLFFILSGFLITGILLTQKTNTIGQYFSHFYERRIKRIFPPYILLMVVISALFGLAWLKHWYLYLFLMNLLPFSKGAPEPVIILWSLGVEEQFYFFWPIAVFLLSEKRLFWLSIFLILLAPVLRGMMTPHVPDHNYIYLLMPFRVDLLATGALLALIWRKNRVAIERWGGYGVLLSLVAAGVLLVLSRRKEFSSHANTVLGNVLIYELTLFICLGVTLWALTGKRVGLLQWKPIRYLGQISYSSYLIHTTALELVKQRWHGAWIRGGIGLALTLAYAALSWHLLEKPILTRGLRPSPRIESVG